ncbi:PilZ domain-containing protein [uncultured Desulfosarcina sp.]|uniref:PilZ domain-containing protein n=1 Tax=uncultured Desulfosarcina sp. TaxID=218289 RepID=UPI0029C952A6|nr:PilZ domain-containing protein [uncultured Desulfosarcina sp.]
MMPRPNRPKNSRRTSYIIAEYTVKEGTHRDVIKNIGAGGLFIRTSRKISDGQSIKLEFPLFRFDNTVQVSGKVVRVESDGFAVAFDELLDALASKNGQLPEIVHEINRST